MQSTRMIAVCLVVLVHLVSGTEVKDMSPAQFNTWCTANCPQSNNAYCPYCGTKTADDSKTADGSAGSTGKNKDLSTATPAPVAASGASRRILCLHGGGGSAAGMAAGTVALQAALGSSFQFVFAYIGNYSTGETWWADPLSKDHPTTDPNHASAMVTALNATIAAQGPFYGIVGYSQGAAAVPVYLSQVAAGTFQMAVMFCGYLPTTHTGLVSQISSMSPFGNIRALVWMGTHDTIISNAMTTAQAAMFTAPTIVTSAVGGHAFPGSSDPTFNEVLAFMGAGDVTVTTNSGAVAGAPIFPLGLGLALMTWACM